MCICIYMLTICITHIYIHIYMYSAHPYVYIFNTDLSNKAHIELIDGDYAYVSLANPCYANTYI